MSETIPPQARSLQTRTEHSRSIEDAEKYRALDTLKKIGLLIPLSELETFHGRLGTTEEVTEWSVDPSFANGGNDSGNNNANDRPTLYTGKKELAKEFAQKRVENIDLKVYSEGEGLKAQVHEIVTSDTDATVLDFDFDVTKLDDEAREEYRQALKALTLPITEGSPVDFYDHDTIQPFEAAINKLNKNLILSSDVAELASQAGINERVALQLSSACNSRYIGMIRPSYLVSELIKHPVDIFVDSLEVNGQRQKVPINLEYVQRLLREAHIVGVKQKVSSDTLNRGIDSVSLFDLEKVTTTKSLETEKQAIWKKLGSMSMAFSQFSTEFQHNQPLLRLLEDAYVKPDKLVEAARTVDSYDSIFDSYTGNWEGFTLAEHTETVLRNFDENYADKVPVELLAPMRLAILAHDVGKPIATARGEKDKQKEYNVAQANDFLSKLGVDDKLKSLLLAVIGDGQQLAFQIEIKGAGEPAQKAMNELATRALRQFYNSERVTDGQITSFIEMCKMLLVCDGGAYTSMATTRLSGNRGIHRNAPSFNSSFAQPVGFGKRSLKLAKNGEVTANPDLTPQVSKTVSKLSMSRSGAGRKAPKLST